MVKYFYDKYTTVVVSESVREPTWVSSSDASVEFAGKWDSYTWNSATGKYTLTGYRFQALDVVQAGYFCYVLEGSTLVKYTAKGYTQDLAQNRISSTTSKKTEGRETYNQVYGRGTLITSNIVGENGTYPTNGRHNDGFWYIQRGVVPTNAIPTLSIATTDNRTLYENDQFNVTGQVTDTDVGNVVIVKFSINGGTERAIASPISQGTAVTYNKVLTFKQGKLFDGANAITDTLADGSQHVLRVWAEDDKGGKSAEQVRVFYVVANRSAVLTINPVTTVSDLIDSDTIAINGNASDPDGNTVTVRYKIGNGLYTQVYSGTGGAFNFNVSLADLQTGVNTVMVQATDSYGLSTTKTLRVTKTFNSRPLLKANGTYKLTPPNGSADGIVLWVQRETGDLIVNAEISMGANGAVENFVPMVKDSTAYVTDAIEEDEFTFDNGAVSAENIVVRLTMERTSATSDKGIKLISGVLS